MVRLLVYPLAILVIPAIWWLHGRPRPYPYLADIAFVTPFILDAARIGLELARSPGFDALPHVGGWLAISVAVGLAVGPIIRSRPIAFALMVGTGATVAIVWEVGEYVIARNGGGLELTYGNTIADLALSLTGAIAGACLVVVTLWPAASTPRTLFGWER